jgi:hypothetical protein
MRDELRYSGVLMKTIGLIGGLSWESSKEYYRIINETVNEKLGGLHSAKRIPYSLDQAECMEIQKTKGWDELAKERVGGERVGVEASCSGYVLDVFVYSVWLSCLRSAGSTSQTKTLGAWRCAILPDSGDESLVHEVRDPAGTLA